MNIERRPLDDKRQTGRQMHRMVRRFSSDLQIVRLGETPVSRLSLPRFYNLVRALPYRRDTSPVEVVTRPQIAFLRALRPSTRGIDCKKKATIVASWAAQQRPPIPYRFVASSARPDGRAHHVYPELYIRGKWLPVDATYPHYRLGRRGYTETSREILK